MALVASCCTVPLAARNALEHVSCPISFASRSAVACSGSPSSCNSRCSITQLHDKDMLHACCLAQVLRQYRLRVELVMRCSSGTMSSSRRISR